MPIQFAKWLGLIKRMICKTTLGLKICTFSDALETISKSMDPKEFQGVYQ